MKKRHIEIVRCIYENGQISIEELLKIFDISKRTLYYDIEEINYEISDFGQIKNVNRMFTYIGDIEDLAKIVENGHYDFDAKARSRYVLYKLLNCNFNTINDIADEFEISKSTAVNTIDDIRKFLESLGLKLEYSDRYYITGNESLVRNLFIELMAEDNNLINTLDAEIVELNSIAHLELSDYSLAALSKFTHFIEKRIKQGFLINKEDKFEEAKRFQHYSAVSNVLQFHDENEIAYMTLFIATLSSMNPQISQDKIQKSVERLVDLFELTTGIAIEDKTAFKKYLGRHVLASYYRIKYEFPIFNPSLEEIKIKYADLFNLTKQLLTQVSFADFKKIPDAEVAYITMYFGGNMQKHHEVKNRVVIVCPNGLMVSKTVETQLLNYIPMIDVVAVVPMYEIDEYQGQYDYIVSTIPLPGYDNVIVVKPMLTKANIGMLMNKIFAMGPTFDDNKINEILEVIERNCIIQNKNKLVNELYGIFSKNTIDKERNRLPMLKELLTRDKMKHVKSCKDWEDAIATAAQPLIDQGKITKVYVDAMIESVKTHGPYIVLADRFALPHASAGKGVNELSMSLLHVDESVDVLGKPVNVFVVLATIDNKMHMAALAALSELLYEEKNLKIFLSGDLDAIDKLIQSTK